MLNYSKVFLHWENINSTHTRCVIPKQEVVNCSCSTMNWILSFYTVDSLLTDTSVKRTPRVGPCLCCAYSLYLTLYKKDISLRRTLRAGPKGVRLGESWLYNNITDHPGLYSTFSHWTKLHLWFWCFHERRMHGSWHYFKPACVVAIVHKHNLYIVITLLCNIVVFQSTSLILKRPQ